MLNDVKSLKEPIGQTLCRVSKELVSIADLVGGLEDAVGAVLQGEQAPIVDRIEELQRLDLIRQHMVAVSDFVAAVASGSSSAWLVDVESAVNCVTLSEVAGRLAERTTISSDNFPSNPGDFDQFN
jgi:hypothetical protein